MRILETISYHWLQLRTIDALWRWAQKHLNADKLNCNKLFEIFNEKVYAALLRHQISTRLFFKLHFVLS